MSVSLNSSTPSNSPNSSNSSKHFKHFEPFESVRLSRVLYELLYECLPRTLRTPLISPYTPNTPTLPYTLNQVKHFEPLGHFPSLKEIDFNASQCVGRSNTSNRSNRSNCLGSYKSRTLGIFGMDRMGRIDRTARIAQGVI